MLEWLLRTGKLAPQRLGASPRSKHRVLHAWAQSELFELPSVFELTTSVRGSGKLLLLARPSVEADNEPGKEPVIKIVESQVPALSSKIQVPPINVSVYEFEIENG
jgi:hypothetical protein